jgi:hypothetical protein
MKQVCLSLVPIAVAILFFIPFYLPIDTVIDTHHVNQGGFLQNGSGSTNDVDYWALLIVTDSGGMDRYYIYDALCESPNWDQAHITFLLDETATKSNILESIDWLKNQADDNDIVVFSFQGHGTHNGTFWTGTYGIVPNEGGIITREELDDKFDQIQAGGLCLIFDCCLSGNLVDSGIHPCRDEDFGSVKEFSCGLEGENRVVLMSTLKYGLGFSDSLNQIYFSRFVAEAFSNSIDYNQDGFCSAEETFTYARDKFYPYAYEMLLYPLMQIFTFSHNGFFILAFPTLYDAYPGELPLIPIETA